MAAKKVLPPKEFKQKYYSPNGEYKTIVKKRYDMPETSKEKRTVKGVINRAPKPMRDGAPLMKNEEPLRYAKKGGWIQGAIKKPGALREQLGVKKGDKIPKAKLAAAAKKGGKLGQRARLAITLGKMNKNR
jgi:hypothetical protein